jgi:hypothetical protein
MAAGNILAPPAPIGRQYANMPPMRWVVYDPSTHGVDIPLVRNNRVFTDLEFLFLMRQAREKVSDFPDTIDVELTDINALAEWASARVFETKSDALQAAYEQFPEENVPMDIDSFPQLQRSQARTPPGDGPAEQADPSEPGNLWQEYYPGMTINPVVQAPQMVPRSTNIEVSEAQMILEDQLRTPAEVPDNPH